MRTRQSLARLGAVCLCLLGAFVAVTGCRGRSASTAAPAETTTAVESQPATIPMPALVGKTLASAYSVDGVSDLDVLVDFPAVEATWSAQIVPDAKAKHLSGTQRGEFPEQILQLGEVRRALHTVVAQTPAAGTPVSSEVTVTLVVGPHPNPTHDPWAMGHIEVVGTNGPESCMQCHSPTTCAECHERFR